jgi:hypothetical protein
MLHLPLTVGISQGTHSEGPHEWASNRAPKGSLSAHPDCLKAAGPENEKFLFFSNHLLARGKINPLCHLDPYQFFMKRRISPDLNNW